MVNRRRKDRKIDRLHELRDLSHQGGGQAKIDSQHKRGKLTARERIHLFLDEGSFEELDSFVTQDIQNIEDSGNQILGDAVITGFGTVNGETVFVYSQDFTVFGGSLSEAVAQKICKIMDLALQNGCPVVGLIDSGGARIQEGVSSLAGYGDIFLRNTMASGVIPQISVILGPAAGGATYSPALTDFIFMVSGVGQMYITGPDVIKAVTGEQVTHEDLGGAASHSSKSGVSHFRFDSEEECLKQVRRLLTFIPSNNMEEPVIRETSDELEEPDTELERIVPEDPNQPYDVMDVIGRLIDQGDFMEIHHSWAKNIVVGFAKIAGQSVGIVGQQPEHLAGSLDIDASVKAARFIRFCDSFNIPLLTLIDVPGFMPGTAQEYGGIIRHGAKLIYAYAEATVPKISVLLRKAYGGAYIVMSSKMLGGDMNYAWPTGEIAVMGAEGAVNIIHGKEIKSAQDPEKLKSERIEQYRQKLMNPYVAASKGLIDAVIDPSETRIKIISALKMLSNKRDSLPIKKHGSIPL